MSRLLTFIIILSTLLLNCQNEEKENTLLPISVNGNFGFINYDGEMVIEPIYDDFEGYSNGIIF